MISVRNVSKMFRLYQRPSGRILEMVPFLARRRYHRNFWALRDISFSADRGEVLGIVGPNGSGKTTLLEIVSGILRPTMGRVVTGGRIATLLELGAGFNPEFTGRENVIMNGEIMGMSRGEMEAALPRIEDFAGIGDFISRPVKEYSAGMYVRLAFATAIHIDPEILVVDEALAVGDAIFAARCVRKFEELRERKVTVLFVSHDLGLVKRLAHRAIFLVNGRIEAEGSPNEVVNRYVGMVLARGHEPFGNDEHQFDYSYRHGDGISNVEGVWLLDSLGHPVRSILSGDTVTVRVRARFRTSCKQPVVGILVRNRLGMDVFGTNTRLEGKELGTFLAGEAVEIDFRFECRLTQGEYTLTVATQHWDGSSQDWLDDVLSFQVTDPKGSTGLVNFETGINWRRFAQAVDEPDSAESRLFPRDK